MIEIHRARLLAGGNGSSASTPSSSLPYGSQANTAASGTSYQTLTSNRQQQQQQQHTPQQAAAAEQRLEDAQMQVFLHRLQNRNDSRPQSSSAPTVPTVLSRRMLQKQGVGYLDDTVAAVVSGAADRFLATVLQQANACCEERLKGVEIAREAKRRRRRHMQQYEADVAERTRIKAEREEKRERDNLAALRAADALKTKPSGSLAAQDDDGINSKNKKKADELQMNGNKRKENGADDDDQASYDSIDEEEEYYQERYNDEAMPDTSDDEEDEKILILRDIARPLMAWDFHIDGKIGMEPLTEDHEAVDLPVEAYNSEDDYSPLEAQDDGSSDEKEGFNSGSKVAKSADDDKNTSRKTPRSSPSPKPPAQSSTLAN
jgi:hypothetical protein